MTCECVLQKAVNLGLIRWKPWKNVSFLYWHEMYLGPSLEGACKYLETRPEIVEALTIAVGAAEHRPESTAALD
jgi:hypothetical protein